MIDLTPIKNELKKVHAEIKRITLRDLKYFLRVYCAQAVSFLEKYCPLVPRLLVAMLPLKRTCSECARVKHMRGKQFYSYYDSFSAYIERLANDWRCYDCYKDELQEKERMLEDDDCQYYDDICTCNCCPDCLEKNSWILDLIEVEGIAKAEIDLSNMA